MSTHIVTPPALDPAMVERVRALAAEWREATRWDAGFVSTIPAHPAYRAIMAMGPAVVPVILAEMTVRPSWWFVALEELTGEDPVPDEHSGSLDAMTEDWSAWGRARGLV